MRHTSTQTRTGPEFTPIAVKNLILITCFISIGSVLLEPIFNDLLGLPGPQSLLSLSLWGLQHYFFWQPVSYLFTYTANGSGISFFWLISLAISMYMIWIIGSQIVEMKGTGPFLRLYFLSGISSGLAAMSIAAISAKGLVLGGPSTAIFAMLVVWSMFNPHSTLLLFFIIPVKTRWLVAGIIGAFLLIALSNGQWIRLVYYLTGAGIGYLYGVLAWNLQSPFPATHKYDEIIANVGNRFRQNSYPISSRKKIINIRTNKNSAKDEQFMDDMLDKISKKGKSALNYWERIKMYWISRKYK